jgi:hypothetical protein
MLKKFGSNQSRNCVYIQATLYSRPLFRPSCFPNLIFNEQYAMQSYTKFVRLFHYRFITRKVHIFLFSNYYLWVRLWKRCASKYNVQMILVSATILLEICCFLSSFSYHSNLYLFPRYSTENSKQIFP